MIILERQPYARLTTKGLVLANSMTDAEVKKLAPQFDGLEKAFALIPVAPDRWQRIELPFAGTTSFGTANAMTTFDSYAVTLPLTQLDPALVARMGVAFGFDTNVGTVWMQRAGNNVIPRQPDRSIFSYGKITR